jgi:rhodanese-related sulfurtransferase
MSRRAADLVSEAESRVENLTPEAVQRELAENAALVDLREPAELEDMG